MGATDVTPFLFERALQTVHQPSEHIFAPQSFVQAVESNNPAPLLLPSLPSRWDLFPPKKNTVSATLPQIRALNRTIRRRLHQAFTEPRAQRGNIVVVNVLERPI